MFKLGHTSPRFSISTLQQFSATIPLFSKCHHHLLCLPCARAQFDETLADNILRTCSIVSINDSFRICFILILVLGGECLISLVKVQVQTEFLCVGKSKCEID